MMLRPPGSKRTDTLFPSTTLVRAARVLGRVGEDAGVDEAFLLERGADRADAPVHHVAGRDHVGAGARVRQRLLHQRLDGDVVHHVAGVVDDAVLRSDEHTSELPSLMRHSYAVFWLKQNTKKT